MKKTLVSLFALFSLLLTGCQETSVSNSVSNSNESLLIKDEKILLIEEKIDTILKMDNTDGKLMKMMSIEEEINNLSIDEKNSVANINDFFNEKTNTALSLKENVNWSSCLNKDDDYFLLGNLLEISNIKNLDLIKNFSSVLLFIEEPKELENIINMISVPYIDIIGETIDFYMLIDVCKERYFMSSKIDNGFVNFHVYDNGYITLSIEQNEVRKTYVSIVKIDFELFKEACPKG